MSGLPRLNAGKIFWRDDGGTISIDAFLPPGLPIDYMPKEVNVYSPTSKKTRKFIRAEKLTPSKSGKEYWRGDLDVMYQNFSGDYLIWFTVQSQVAHEDTVYQWEQESYEYACDQDGCYS